jgi:hypothetical protein
VAGEVDVPVRRGPESAVQDFAGQSCCNCYHCDKRINTVIIAQDYIVGMQGPARERLVDEAKGIIAAHSPEVG